MVGFNTVVSKDKFDLILSSMRFLGSMISVFLIQEGVLQSVTLSTTLSRAQFGLITNLVPAFALWTNVIVWILFATITPIS